VDLGGGAGVGLVCGLTLLILEGIHEGQFQFPCVTVEVASWFSGIGLPWFNVEISWFLPVLSVDRHW
jgi:hypothetical protein